MNEVDFVEITEYESGREIREVWRKKYPCEDHAEKEGINK